MAAIDDLTNEMTEAILDQVPAVATVFGVRGHRDSLLTDYRAEAEPAVEARLGDIVARTRALDAATLTPQQRITARVIEGLADEVLTRFHARLVEFTICDNFSAPAIELLVILPMTTLADAEQCEAYLRRLNAVPDALAALADRHRAGLAAGLLPVRRLVDDAIEFFDRYLGNDGDPLRRPTSPDSVDGADFAARREDIISTVVRPAYAQYRDMLRAELAPVARDLDHPGLCWLPGGDAIYADLIRLHTTTTRTAGELHELGLRVVAELEKEYREIGSRVFGLDDPAQIFQRLRTDPDLRWKNPDEPVQAAKEAMARAETAAPQWFGRLPSQRCEIQRVPDDEAPGASGAYYMPPAVDGSRPGIFFTNTYNAQERDRYGSESTTFHEAVPGHHFQCTIAQELPDMPLLRQLAPFTAYAEGWGLYAERLADEMGLYSDDIARLGMLSNDSMRATRLVVDTGLHAKGWNRQQAVEYMTENSAMMPVEIDSEVDRYIAEPGQALAYMVGRIEIQRLRAEAEAALGDRFDIRAFHDVVLGSGSVPLNVLESLVKEWVAGRQG
jgi:uncharacterized protein (DUF885 family)